MEICSMDVSNAFLQGDLHERIFLRCPPGLHAAFPENTVWQLCHPVYGLKQVPRKWHAKLSATLGSLGFSESHSNASLFIRSSPRRFFILVYVDDMILLSDSKADREQMKMSLQQRLKCKDLGDLTDYLGMTITRDRSARTITLSQSHYIGQALEKLLSGSSATFVLTLGGPSPPLLSGFSDSSRAGSQPNRRSSQGYGFTLGSGLISWRSTRSSTISLSTCEGKLYTGTMAALESRWLCFLLAEIGAPQPCPTLWCDNASTIHLTQDPVYHARSKHIELRYFFIYELVQQGLIFVREIAAEANLADIFTKALLCPAHSAFLRLIGLARPGAP
ncbi:unnamed protein product [Closterium sp. NIES-54]